MNESPTRRNEPEWRAASERLAAPGGMAAPYAAMAPVQNTVGGRHATAEVLMRDRRFGRYVEVPDRPMWRMFQRWMFNRSQADHAPIRSLLSKAFTKQAVASYRPSVEAEVEGLLDALVPRGAMDVKADFAHALPFRVITRLMAIDEADLDGLRRWTGNLTEGFVRQASGGAEIGDAGATALMEYFDRVLRERRAHPGDDLLSLLVADTETDQVDWDDLVANAVLLVDAGHATTMNLITNGTLLLLQHPEQLSLVRSEPERIPAAVEEMLRFEPPIQITERLALDDVEVGGHLVKRNELINIPLGLVNRDPDQFDRPDEFDVTRTPNRHHAFTAGAHHCLGAGLARMEAVVAFEAMLRRLPDLRLVNEPEWIGLFPFRTLDAVEVAWG